MKSKRIIALIALTMQLLRIKLGGGRDAGVQYKKAIFVSFGRLGGVYVKFLQQMAAGARFMEGWSTPADYAVFENNTYEQLNIRAYLAHELGGSIDQFASVDPLPFAAGSFGQVFRARLLAGDEVVVKILKPQLVSMLAFDLGVLRAAVRIIRVIKQVPMIDIVRLFDDFAHTTFKETDYIAEAAATQKLRDFYAYDSHIVIPKIYAGLSGKRVITQEYIGGISLAEFATRGVFKDDAEQCVKDVLGSDIRKQLTTLGAALVRAIIWLDIVPGDPHGGNVRLLPGNKVGMIDFGIVARAPHQKRQFISLMSQYKSLFENKFDAGSFMLDFLRFFDEGLAGSLDTVKDYAQNNADVFDALSQSAKTNFAKQSESKEAAMPLNNKYIVKIFVSLVNNNNKYGLKFNTDMTGIFKTGRTFMELPRQFCAQGQDQQIMHAVLEQEIAYATNHSDLMPLDLSDTSISLDRAVETVAEWIGVVADKDPLLYAQIHKGLTGAHYA